MDSAGIVVRQSLFTRTTRGTAATWEFVITGDGGCATLRDGVPVVTGGPDAEDVERVLNEFLRASDPRPPAEQTGSSAPDGGPSPNPRAA